jgi:Uncharacterized alpha/beta hydrolase domain (DUF2235)
MTKNIVFCADGTWNGPGQPDNDDKSARATNVLKLFLNLAGQDEPDSFKLANEQERTLSGADGAVRQASKYLHGVGDSDNFLVKALGGTLGAGLITRIVRGYTFISRNYAQGDKVFIVGFSRGAYTARALAGLIAAKGLLDATRIDLTKKETAYRLGAAVWYAYRNAALRSNTDWFGRLEEMALDLPAFLSLPPRDDLLIPAPIEAVAVWDTVGALGIPEFTVQMERVDSFQFADRKLSPIVRNGLHAIAVDEQRADFTPTLWDADARITQVLFPGAHGDVGGGYATADNESGLADSALRWMMDELASLGVVFADPLAWQPKPDACATAHQPWTNPPWPLLPRGSRHFPAGLYIARLLLDRLAGGPVLGAPGMSAAIYAPGNLEAYVAGMNAADGVRVV